MKKISLLTLTCLLATACDANTESPYFRDVTSTHLQSSRTAGNSMDGHAIDIDDDGDIDLIIAAEFRRNILLINDGTGKLVDESDRRLPETAHDSEDIAVADFDDDGDLDIVFVSEDDRTDEYLENLGNAIFELRTGRIPVNGTSNAVQTTDFNGDGHPDLIIGNAGQNILLINDGTGRFSDETSARLPRDDSVTQDLAVYDVDLDGDLDIIEANESQNRLLINDGTGRFLHSPTKLPSADDQSRDIEVADIDRDGDLDLLFANVDFGGIGDPRNRLLINQGNGRFAETTALVQFAQLPTVDINVFDIDGDGLADILSGNRGNGMTQLVFLQQEDGTFKDRTGDILPAIDDYTFDFQVADFNGDNRLDIYFCNFRGPDRLLFGR